MKSTPTNATEMPDGQQTFLCDSRVLVWFSCGAASAVAAKLAVEAYPECEVLYCNLFTNEDRDNPRFLADVERWIGRKIKLLQSDRFKTCEEVWESVGFLKNQYGAPCTKFLKRYVREAYQHLEDRHIFGFTSDERDRIEEFELSNPNLKTIWLLEDKGITKQECYRMITAAGIKLPDMYIRGYKNNNCIGCVKGGAGYWNKIRRDFPGVFAARAAFERKIGYALLKLRGVPCFLDELSPNAGRYESERAISCGPDCKVEDQEP